MKNFLYEAEQQVNTTVNYKKIRKKENFSNCQFNIFIFLPQLTRVFLGTSKHSIPRSFQYKKKRFITGVQYFNKLEKTKNQKNPKKKKTEKLLICIAFIILHIQGSFQSINREISISYNTFQYHLHQGVILIIYISHQFNIHCEICLYFCHCCLCLLERNHTVFFFFLFLFSFSFISQLLKKKRHHHSWFLTKGG